MWQSSRSSKRCLNRTKAAEAVLDHWRGNGVEEAKLYGAVLSFQRQRQRDGGAGYRKLTVSSMQDLSNYPRTTESKLRFLCHLDHLSTPALV
jgi:hypothetical protein